MSCRSVVRIVFLVVACALSWGSPVDADMFVSAAGRNSVMRFDANTGQLLGDFVAPGAGGLVDPQGIAFGPDGNLYVSSNGSDNVLRFDGETGQFIDVFASTNGLLWPAEINIRNGYLYVSDFSAGASGRVSRFDAITGEFVDHFITGATLADGQSWDIEGNLLLSNFGTGSVRKYNGVDGTYMGDFVAPGVGGLSGPLDNLLLPNGNLLVSSFNTGSIKQYDANGNYLNDPITGLFGGPQGLAIGPDGMLYAGDFGRGIINRYDIATLAFVDQFATTGGLSTTNNFTFSPSPIPEPSSSVLVGLAIGSVLRRGRKQSVAAS